MDIFFVNFKLKYKYLKNKYDNKYIKEIKVILRSLLKKIKIITQIDIV